MSWIPSSSWRADETSHPARVESPCPAGRERTPARSNTRCGQVFASLNVFAQALDGLNSLLTTYREYSKHRGASTAGAANLLQCRDALVSGQYGDLDHILVLPKYMLLELTILELVDAEVASVYSTLGLSATLYSKLDMIAEISGRTAESLGLIPTSFQVEAQGVRPAGVRPLRVHRARREPGRLLGRAARESGAVRDAVGGGHGGCERQRGGVSGRI